MFLWICKVVASWFRACASPILVMKSIALFPPDKWKYKNEEGNSCLGDCSFRPDVNVECLQENKIDIA